MEKGYDKNIHVDASDKLLNKIKIKMEKGNVKNIHVHVNVVVEPECRETGWIWSSCPPKEKKGRYWREVDDMKKLIGKCAMRSAPTKKIGDRSYQREGVRIIDIKRSGHIEYKTRITSSNLILAGDEWMDGNWVEVPEKLCKNI